MARFAQIAENSPTGQARRVGAAVLVALLLAIAMVVTLGGSRSSDGTDVAGKSWWRIVTPEMSSTGTDSAARASGAIVDGKYWA